MNATVGLGASVVLTFALNNSGPIREDVVVNLQQFNLESFGFVIRFIRVFVGTNTTSVNTTTVSFFLNAAQRVVLDLKIAAPPTWPRPLPTTVHFEVRTTTRDGVASAILPVALDVTA